MALFGNRLTTCPLCGAGLPAKENKLSHYAGHAIASDNGDYYWECTCGEKDGYWNETTGVAASLAQHFAHRHGISLSESMGN
jgi:hypothetical protein